MPASHRVPFVPVPPCAVRLQGAALTLTTVCLIAGLCTPWSRQAQAGRSGSRRAGGWTLWCSPPVSPLSPPPAPCGLPRCALASAVLLQTSRRQRSSVGAPVPAVARRVLRVQYGHVAAAGRLSSRPTEYCRTAACAAQSPIFRKCEIGLVAALTSALVVQERAGRSPGFRATSKSGGRTCKSA